MFEYLKKMNPTDPESAYKLAAVTAIVGSVGSFVAVMVQSFASIYIYKDDGYGERCDMNRIKAMNQYCLTLLLQRRQKAHVWNRASHLITLLLNTIMILPFFVMEDIFSEFESAGTARVLLMAAIILEVMKSAFHVGLTDASGNGARKFPDSYDDVHWYPANEFSFEMMDSGFTWITFLRDTIFAVGIYMMSHLDRQSNKIGQTWQVIGYVATVFGVATSVTEFLKVVQYDYFNSLSDWTYGIFWLAYLVWICYFGIRCRQLYQPDGGDEASSASDMDDDDLDIVSHPAVGSAITEVGHELGDGEKKKKRKKKTKKHHHATDGEDGEAAAEAANNHDDDEDDEDDDV